MAKQVKPPSERQYLSGDGCQKRCEQDRAPLRFVLVTDAARRARPRQVCPRPTASSVPFVIFDGKNQGERSDVSVAGPNRPAKTLGENSHRTLAGYG